ncbi:hypothetical protein ACJ2A9_01930 [Anaerobacillus sp. MEB173]|uniref:hypothetical protein n=1 Tax=Anaerobacillus sp. MEB173 TaxID=3383345 RepID=UPI003F8DCC5B
MAFGIKRAELYKWKEQARSGNIALLTHYWLHPRYPNVKTVTKAACCELDKLIQWGAQYGLEKEWIHHRSDYPHFDLLGEKQLEILKKEGLEEQIERFKLEKDS